MTLKSAALFAFVGILLLTVLLAAGFLRDVLSFGRGLIPALHVLTSMICFVAALSLTVFLYVFHRSQS